MPTSPKTWSEARRLALKQARKMTDAEDARIAAGIAADPDTVDLDDRWFAKAKPARGRPRLPDDKRLEVVTLHVEPDVMARYRATGKGFQAEMRKSLRDGVDRLVARDEIAERRGEVRFSKKHAAKAAKRSPAKAARKSTGKKSTPRGGKR